MKLTKLLYVCYLPVWLLLSGCIWRPRVSPYSITSPPVVTQAVERGKAGITSMELSPNGDYLAIGSAYGISVYQAPMLVKLWDSAPTENRFGDSYVRSIGFSSDSNSLYTGHAGFVIAWNTIDGEALYRIDGLALDVESIATHPGGGFIAIGLSGETIIVWDTTQERSELKLKGESIGDGAILHVTLAWNPEGSQIASGGADTAIRVWSIEGELLTTLDLDDLPLSIEWSPDGNYLAANTVDELIHVWQSVTWQHWSLRTEGQSVFPYGSGATTTDIAWSPDSTLIAQGMWAGRIVIWDTATRQVLHILKGHTNSVHSLAWSPDGKVLYSADSDGSIVVWDLVNEVPLSTIRP